MKIEIIPCLNDNYSYLIFEKETNTVSIIDPSEFDSCDKVISKYKKLDYIMNTHHHFDHIGGNVQLKKKYHSKVLGFNADKHRIPGIDIFLEEDQKQKIGDLEFKVIFVPGHTKGHIAFYFEKEKTVFTGDTLFSLGCGKIFEGDYKQMFNSITKIKNLPKNTKIYFGHEYTKKNLEFCKKYEFSNEHLINKENWLNDRYKKNLPSVPITIGEELDTNIFLRCDKSSVKKNLNMQKSSEEEIFKKLRDLKDSF